MHSHVLTDSIRTAGTHLISTSCSAQGSVYKCSAALIWYWLQIRKCPGVLTEINSEPLRHSDPLQRCLFSRRITKRLGKASHLSQLSLYTLQSHGNVSQWVFFYTASLCCVIFKHSDQRKRKFRCSGSIWCLWGFFFGMSQSGLLFVNGYCNIGFSISGITEGCNMQMRAWTNHHVVSSPPTAT